LPPTTIATIDRALSFYPEDRPQSIDELRAGLGWRQRPSGIEPALNGGDRDERTKSTSAFIAGAPAGNPGVNSARLHGGPATKAKKKGRWLGPAAVTAAAAVVFMVIIVFAYQRPEPGKQVSALPVAKGPATAGDPAARAEVGYDRARAVGMVPAWDAFLAE